MKTKETDFFEFPITAEEPEKCFLFISDNSLHQLLQAGCMNQKNQQENEFGQSYWATGNFDVAHLVKTGNLSLELKKEVTKHIALITEHFGLPYYQTITLVPTEKKGIFQIEVNFIADYVPMGYSTAEENQEKLDLFCKSFEFFQQKKTVDEFRLKIIFDRSQEEEEIDNMMAAILDTSEGIAKWRKYLAGIVGREVKEILASESKKAAETFKKRIISRTPDIY